MCKRPKRGLTPVTRVHHCVHMHRIEHEHMLSVQDAAERLSESRWTTQRRIRRGELPAIVVGKAYIVDSNDIDRLLAERAERAS